MHPRTLLLLIAGFVGGLALASCGTATTCSKATCGGCCDATGKCQSGSTAETCGVDGASCGRCGTGTVCQSGECRAGSTGGGGGATGGGGGATGGGTGGGSVTGGGTGGGTTGGGTGGGATGGGTGGGGATGCRIIGQLDTTQANLATAAYRPFTTSQGHYNFASWVYPTGGNPDGFRFEDGYPGDVFPSFPQNGSFTNIGYFSCSVCAIFYENCAPGAAVCGKEYLAQSGTFSITRADRAPAGRLQGSATSVRFNEWNINSDVASGTGCVIINSIGPFDIGWNADGGAPPP